MTNYKSFHDFEDDRPSLSMDERIVWISDNGPEYGNVRWLGKLPDLGKEWMAGVEFDNPVGSGTGLYKDRQLFVTPLNHASLVPVIGLLKASDFDGPPEPPLRNLSSRLIEFSPTPPLESSNNHYKSDIKNNLAGTLTQFKSSLTHPENVRISSNNRQSPASKHNQHAPVVRNIPIRVERDDKPSDFRSNSPVQLLNQRQVPPVTTSHKSNRTREVIKSRDNVEQDVVSGLTSALNQSSLGDVFPTTAGNYKSQGLPLLPPPTLVVPPGEKNPVASINHLLGKSKGIRGYNNSCYLDATLFAMFSSTTLFDSLLYRPPNGNDIPEYKEIQKILRDDIVRPLRDDYIVSADKVMSFRTMLERSSSVKGLTDEEKDPEEFLSLLLGQILKAEPYLKLSSGLESFFYQLIVDKDESVVLPTVQDLFDQSFVGSTVRLRAIPPCLLMHMPRFGRQYKTYSRIMPSPKLDITDVLESAPRSCGHRGKDCDNIARYECKDCLREQSGRNGTRLASVTYCQSCFHSKHFGKSHITGIEDHDKTKTPLNMTPKDAILRYSNKSSSAKDKEIPRVYMDLFAVLCIETSHYVCFVKCGPEPDAPWVFFDSMADRKGEQNGYNIPEVLLFDEFAFWTSDNGVTYLLNHKDDKLLPEMARRLICDAYVCFYQYNGLTNYR